jgi:hypothetical protein
VYAASYYKCMRPSATSVCALKLLVYAGAAASQGIGKSGARAGPAHAAKTERRRRARKTARRIRTKRSLLRTTPLRRRPPRPSRPSSRARVSLPTSLNLVCMYVCMCKPTSLNLICVSVCVYVYLCWHHRYIDTHTHIHTHTRLRPHTLVA